MKTKHRPCPPSLAKEWCFVFKLLKGDLCSQGSAMAVMAGIRHGIPLPRLSVLSMYFWLRLSAMKYKHLAEGLGVHRRARPILLGKLLMT
jgi:hypothetical protein